MATAADAAVPTVTSSKDRRTAVLTDVRFTFTTDGKAFTTARRGAGLAAGDPTRLQLERFFVLTDRGQAARRP